MASIFQYGVKAAERLATATRNGMLKAEDFARLRVLDSLSVPALLLLLDPPRCVASGVATSCPNVNWTALAISSASENTAGSSGGAAPIAANRFTVPVGGGGRYIFQMSVWFAASAVGAYREISFYINGATFRGPQMTPPIGAGNTTWLTTTMEVRLAAGDYVQALAIQDTGASLNATLDSFTGRRVCA